MPKPTLCIVLTALAAYSAPYTARVVAGSDWIGDNGPSRDSLLFQAEGLAADRDGNLYIADAQANRVRQITPTGIIRTVAGTGIRGFSGDGGPATAAKLFAPYGLAVDSTGNLYIADLGNRRVRRVSRDGRISTLSDIFRAPRNIAVDAGGNVYVADFENGSVYRISAGGAVSVVALLKYPAGLALDRNGTLYVGETGTHLVRKLENGAVKTVGTVQTPTGLAFDAQGMLHVADGSGGGIFRFPATGTAAPLLIAARDVAIAANVLYATDGKLVRSIVATGNTVIAGRGDPARGDFGPATEARLNHPSGLALDRAGNLFIADRDNHRIRRVNTQGIITTYAPTATFDQPAAISIDDSGNLFVADQGTGRIYKVTPSGVVSPAASMPKPADIFPEKLEIDTAIQPSSIIAGKNGVLYISEAERDRVWELTPPVIPPDPATLISIVNAASLTGPLAPGMLARVDGAATAGLLFDGVAASVVSETVVVVPESAKPGTALVETSSGARVEVAVVVASPALFVAVNEDGSVNDQTHAADRGSVLVLYGTGQGIEFRPVAVRLSGYEADVLYSGPVAGYPGLWQVNARLPVGFFPPGTHTLTVAVGDALSPPLTIGVH